MDPAEARVLSAMFEGLEIAIVHIFNCLHHKGLLPLAEAKASIERTADGMPTGSPAAGVVLRQIAVLIGQQDDGSPPAGPNQPPPQTRPNLRVIHGGLSDAPP